MDVLVDTSSLVAAVMHKVDLKEELAKRGMVLKIVSETMRELTTLAKGKSTQSTAAQVALLQLEQWQTPYIDTTGHVDDSLVVLGLPVITQDAELKKRLKDKGVDVYTVKQRTITLG